MSSKLKCGKDVSPERSVEDVGVISFSTNSLIYTKDFYAYSVKICMYLIIYRTGKPRAPPEIRTMLLFTAVTTNSNVCAWQ